MTREQIEARVRDMSLGEVLGFFQTGLSGNGDARAQLVDLVVKGERMLPTLHGYVCFFRQQRIEMYAPDLAQAKLKAAAKFKVSVKQAHMVSAHLVERADGSEVVHVADA